MFDKKIMKFVNVFLMLVGFILTLILGLVSIIDSQAVDIVAGIAPTIFTASLFIVGYIGHIVLISKD